MIKTLLRAILINGIALFLASQIITGFHLREDPKSLLIVVGVFTAIHFFVKPILGVFLGPINFLTLGLVSLAIDAAILYGLSVFLPYLTFSTWLFPGLTISGIILPAYHFNQIGSIIASAAVINLIRSFLSYLAS